MQCDIKLSKAHRMIAPNKKEFLKKYAAELKEIEKLRLEEEKSLEQ